MGAQVLAGGTEPSAVTVQGMGGIGLSSTVGGGQIDIAHGEFDADHDVSSEEPRAILRYPVRSVRLRMTSRDFPPVDIHDINPPVPHIEVTTDAAMLKVVRQRQDGAPQVVEPMVPVPPVPPADQEGVRLPGESHVTSFVGGRQVTQAFADLLPLQEPETAPRPRGLGWTKPRVWLSGDKARALRLRQLGQNSSVRRWLIDASNSGEEGFPLEAQHLKVHGKLTSPKLLAVLPKGEFESPSPCVRASTRWRRRATGSLPVVPPARGQRSVQAKPRVRHRRRG